MCPGYKSFQNVNISFEICVNVFQLIQNVNISLEICAKMLGMCADSFKMFGNICKCVPADPKCEYFIRNMCKCVREINSYKMLIFHWKYV